MECTGDLVYSILQTWKIKNRYCLMWLARFLVYLRHLRQYLTIYVGYTMLGIGCLLWSAIAIPLNLILPRRSGVWLGRWMATIGFRVYLFALRMIGLARFDLRELDALRGAGPLIIAPNHPGLLDALMVLSRLPNVTCVFKASLLANPLWGAGARLAGYIRNDWFIGSVNLAVEELHLGSQLLLFPEGTRTEPLPLSDFQAGVAYVSHRAGVPIQTVFIEQDSRFLGKNWPLLKRPDLPMNFRVRLGKRFDSPADPRSFTITLREYFEGELRNSTFGD
jgi:1-acyl-sn-glycerol-3-phosphate acyltransferase